MASALHTDVVRARRARHRTLALVLNSVVIGEVFIACATGVVLGLSYVVGSADGSLEDGLGDAIGIAAVAIGGTGAAFCLWLVTRVGRGLREAPIGARAPSEWLWSDLAASGACAWAVWDTVRSAAGDDQPVNRLYVVGWVLNLGLLLAAAALLWSSNRDAPAESDVS